MELKGLIIFVLIMHIGYALIAYDCRGPNTNVTVISIKDVGECPDPRVGYSKTINDITIIQRNEFSSTRVRTCLVEVTRIIQKCGMFSHLSAVHQGIYTYIHQTGLTECNNLHRFHNFQLMSGKQIMNVKPNATTTVSLTLAGSVDMEGKCSGSTYIENDLTWENVIVTATVKITLREYYATVKLDINEVHLQGGIVCPYLEGYCMDSEAGETVWERQLIDDCSTERYSTLYQGTANIITTNNTYLGKQITYAVVEQQDRVFAISMIEQTTVCSEVSWLTEHPRLLIVISRKERNKLQKQFQSDSRNTNLMMYVNSKFLYVEQAFKQALSEYSAETVHRRCMLQREILRNRLIMTPLATNVVSILLKNTQGYIGRVLGEALYLMQCTPKLVEIRRTNTCYNELPVKLGDEDMYMAPITRILQDHAEQVQCSHLTPSLYYINGEWVGFSPHPQRRITPEVLSVGKEQYPTFVHVQQLSSGGIYTHKEIEDAQRTLTFGIERQAVSTLLTRKMIGLQTESQGFSTTNLFNQVEIKELAHNTFRQLWGWITDIGLVTSSFLGIYVVFRTIKYILGVVLHGFALYETFGLGFTLLASLWNTLAVWMLHRHTNKTNDKSMKESPEEQVETPVRKSAETNDPIDKVYRELTIEVQEV